MTTCNAVNCGYIRNGLISQILGSGITRSFIINGLSAASNVVASIYASTNNIYIISMQASTNNLSITFSSDPGAFIEINYISIG